MTKARPSVFAIFSVAIAIVLPFFGMAQVDKQSEAFPLRASFSAVPVIEMAELEKSRGTFLPIDVRTPEEFNVIHMGDAINVPYHQKSAFIELLNGASKSAGSKRLVFYCNGVRCAKSFEAARDAIAAGVKNVVVFDAGIMAWAKRNPKETFLLGSILSDSKKLISESEFKAHILDKDEFTKRVSESGAVVLDIRDPYQRTKAVPFKAVQPMRFDEAVRFLQLKKDLDKTFFIFDAVGKQVEWLQYYLKQNGYQKYYFLKGGAESV